MAKEERHKNGYLVNRSSAGIATKARYKTEWQRERKQKHKALLNEMKASLGCKTCDEQDYRCLDFHHRDRSTKKMSIGSNTHFSWDLLLAEIAKCEVLCSNCHRKKTYEEVRDAYDYPSRSSCGEGYSSCKDVSSEA